MSREPAAWVTKHVGQFPLTAAGQSVAANSPKALYALVARDGCVLAQRVRGRVGDGRASQDLDSARKSREACPPQPDHDAEALT